MKTMKKAILVVDDEKSIHESIKVMLEDDYSVLYAMNSSQAHDVLKHNKADLVLLDYLLPGKDGFDLLSEFQDRYPNLLVALITGYGSEDTAVKALRSRCQDYFTKPFDTEEFKNKIDKILHQSKELPLTKTETVYKGKPQEKVNTRKKIVNDIIAFIKENFSQPITSGSIAKKMNFEVSYIRKTFKKERRMTIENYLNTFRFARAKEIFDRTDEDIETVISRVGFQSKQMLYKLFKKYLKTTPGKYKKRKSSK